MFIKRVLNSLNYEKKMFVKLLVLVTIPLIVMGIVSFNIYIQSESAKRKLILTAYSDEISMEYNNILTSIKEYYIDAANGDTFKWLIRQKEIPYTQYSTLKQAQNILEGNYFIENYISSYEFINVDNGWVFNNYGLFSYEDTVNKREVDEFLKEQKEEPYSLYWINRQGMESPMVGSLRLSYSIDTTGLNLIAKRGSGENNISWIFLIKINEKALRTLADNYKKLGYDVSMIVNDQVLVETNSKLSEYYLKGEFKDSEVYRFHNGKKYNIHILNKGSSNLSFVVGYDTSMIKRDASVFVLASFVVIVLFILLLVIIRLASIAFSKPLLRLQKFVDDQNKQIKELFVSNLLKGELNGEVIDSNLKKFELKPYPAYQMIAMICKEEQEPWKDNFPEVLNALYEELGEKMFITPVVYEDKLIFILGAENDIEVNNKLVALYKEIKDYITEKYGIVTATGISQTFHKLHHIRRAYGECSEALYNKMNKENQNDSSISLFEDYLISSSGSNVYDKIIENELIETIDNCKEEESIRLLELTIDRMDVKGVVGIERNLYLTRLLTAILNLPGTAGVALSDVFDSEQYNILNRVTQIYEKKEIIRAISQDIIHPIICKLKEKREEGNESEILNQIIKFIKDTKGNITLNEVADQMCYHPNYLSKVLKRDKGYTFTDMVNEEKLKQAKYMLLTTDLSVAEISEKLHYNNVQNFIRFFKNHVEFTPAAFRKEHRK